MKQERLEYLLSTYLDSGLSAGEEKEFMEFMNSQQDMGAVTAQLELLWHQGLTKTVQVDAASEQRIQNVMRQIQPKKVSLSRWISWTAAACLTLTVSFAFFFHFQDQPAPTVLKVAKHTISTGYGERKTVILADGSKVSLNVASSLSYTDDYEQVSRTISLTGEAFFEVVKNPDKPFIVHAAGLYTKVLGTSFNIRSFAEEAKIGIAVATGRVEVGKNTEQLAILKPGQQLEYHKLKDFTTLHTVSIASIADWREGVLVFDGDKFSEVAVKLEKRYNVKITFENKALETCRFKGRFKGLSVDQILHLLKKSSDFNYMIKGRNIQIKGKGCL